MRALAGIVLACGLVAAAGAAACGSSSAATECDQAVAHVTQCQPTDETGTAGLADIGPAGTLSCDTAKDRAVARCLLGLTCEAIRTDSPAYESCANAGADGGS